MIHDAAAACQEPEKRVSDEVEAGRLETSRALDPQARKAFGQFMTPAPIARFMASLFTHDRPAIRLLDAGAGMGSLTAAYVDGARGRGTVRSLEVTAIEQDTQLAEHLRSTLDACGRRCGAAGIQFTGNAIVGDFIEHALDTGLQHGLYDEARLARFDGAILNPPYLKIAATSAHRKRLRLMGIEATNLYSAFLAIALRMLRPGGELVAITPRSFCNGPYFRQFRQELLAGMSLRQIHIYESREDAFRDDDVLQENIILHAVKDRATPLTVRLSTASCAGEIPTVVDMPYDEIVRPDDADAFIHIATSAEDRRHAELVLAQPCTLAQLGLEASTGRVVDFRVREHLRQDPEVGAVPLIYPAHFDSGFVTWPRETRKPNALHRCDQTRELLVPNGVYVLTRRFTSKEERRRVVACVFDPARLGETHGEIGFENHLNYFHAEGAALTPHLARGLAAYLNSTAIDRYFRQFSGHTQVNATDLRSLKYPDAAALTKLGESVGDHPADQAAVDAAISAALQ